ncbi:DNA-binding response regulator [Dactylosporangium sp. NPDC051541]|uniref:DNA-binding response regulator n=1 Tax=Dactylosporangium sp. NPDC051541 TaxID=3363977 RepID=UPI003796061C
MTILLVGLSALTAFGVEAALTKLPGPIGIERFGHRDPALGRVGAGDVDLVILDPHRPTFGDGLRLCRELKQLPSPPYTLALSEFRTRRDVMYCFLAGLDSFVSAHERPERLAAAVTATLGGDREWLLGPPDERRPPGLDGWDDLTPRELEVLWSVLEGRTNRQIASLLSISPNTVKNHVAAILRKLALRRRSELLAGGARRP